MSTPARAVYLLVDLCPCGRTVMWARIQHLWLPFNTFPRRGLHRCACVLRAGDA